jgi:hypothetical protein
MSHLNALSQIMYRMGYTTKTQSVKIAGATIIYGVAALAALRRDFSAAATLGIGISKGMYASMVFSVSLICFFLQIM